MDPAATAYPVARDPPPRPPPQTAQLGQGPGAAPGPHRTGWAVPAILSLAITAAFAWAVYRARHSGRDLAFVITTYYLLALLYCCLGKLDLLRGRAIDDPERRRTRFAVWALAVALGNTVAIRVADAMPYLALKIAVWVVTAVAMGVAFYFLFRGNIRAADAARPRTERALHEMSPEQRV
ncbi:uncharacterized protein LOC100833250 [Brachypodium distachyon]|uniref:Uncharacterized protein n=1 Tax=Brachypodium distachyon TaxID=15368 RepID=I1HCR4_BRADI|nr:uncharacterized protein LOC100833250 [Brachypodium distachyon]KQK03071.1 hypothetical protein BRADI_2g05350v3 [Brachypodium distachyon]|eukprot:XP_003564476.1 uncharacterized protein LOC100833250 [Brachypodium distachyon]